MATTSVARCLTAVHASLSTCISDSSLRNTHRRRCAQPIRCGDSRCEGEAITSTVLGHAPSPVSRYHVEPDLSVTPPSCLQQQTSPESSEITFSRRAVGLALATSSLSFLWQGDHEAHAFNQVEVGAYLPPAGEGDLVVFRPSSTETPAIRAGNVAPYEFFLPPTWKQVRVANIQSGNYCQPKCAEPWVEVKFEDPNQGLIQVVAAPTVRLTNKPNAVIDEIGPPETLIAALGPFVTGNSFDPDEVVDVGTRVINNQKYYTYTLETPFARTGFHNLAVATAKGSTVLLMVVSASQKQWEQHESVLRTVADSFSV